MKRLLLIPLVLFLACEDKQEKDCADVEGGTATVDDCGLCTGGTTELLPNYLMDCAGECGGDAELDNCDQCVGGNSGEVACTQGCNGDWGGTVLIDCLGICGGNTPDADNDGICDWNDGDSYQTIQIGNQIWMAENLKVTHYRNGDEIPTGYSNGEWGNLSTGAYAVYDDDSSNADVYGYLYNWYTVDDDRGVCPESWHVPTDGEWTVLEDFITNDGYAEIDGNALKEIGYEHWFDNGNPNNEGLDIYGFTGLPGGCRTNYYDGYYVNMGYYGYFWSSTEYGNNPAWYRKLYYLYSDIGRGNDGKRYGFSVRCIKD